MAAQRGGDERTNRAPPSLEGEAGAGEDERGDAETGNEGGKGEKREAREAQGHRYVRLHAEGGGRLVRGTPA